MNEFFVYNDDSNSGKGMKMIENWDEKGEEKVGYFFVEIWLKFTCLKYDIRWSFEWIIWFIMI